MKNLLGMPLNLENFRRGREECSSRLREVWNEFFLVSVGGCSAENERGEEEERVELTYIDVCWSMHGSMVDINEVA